MLLAAFVLGIWLGWLIEAVSPRARRRSAHAPGAILVFFHLTFALAAAAFISYLLLRYFGPWNSSVIRVVEFVTAPAQLWAILGFAAGWIGYRFRRPIWLFTRSLFIQPSPARNKPIEARAWLTAAGGLPIIAGSMLVVAIIALGPDLYSRLQSIKWGDIEARFASVTQYSLRTTFREGAGFARKETKLFAMEDEIKEFMETMLKPIQETVIARLELKPLEAAAAAAKRERIVRYHQAIIFPLTKLIEGYAEQFPKATTVSHVKAVKVSRAWSEFSIAATKFSQGASANDRKSLKDAFARLAGETCGPVSIIKKELASDNDKPLEKTPPCEFNTAFIEMADLPAEELSTIFSNGYTIIFVASLIIYSDDYEQAVQYFNRMAPYLDRTPSEPTGELYFYDRLAQAKYYARWFPHDAGADSSRAQEIVNSIIAAMNDQAAAQIANRQKIIAHFKSEKCQMLNSQMFSLIRDWHEGRRLSSEEIIALERLAEELLASMADAQLMSWQLATFADTFAMKDIVVSDLTQDRSKDRCSRILRNLAKAKSNYLGEAQRSGLMQDTEYRAVFRTIEAHYELYKGICERQ